MNRQTPLITVTEVSQEEFERISAECQAKAKRAARNKARRDRDQVMRDLGLVKVRGNLGGTYWE
jgi:hypothetical protein